MQIEIKRFLFFHINQLPVIFKGEKMNIKFSDQELYLDENSIFLAGPTLRDSSFSKSWRKNACKILEELGFDGTVYIPEFYTESVFKDGDYIRQTKWEWDCLNIAGAIVFWVPRRMEDMPALTTNIEFGRYMSEKADQIILGYPNNAEKMRYMDLYYREKTGRIPSENMKSTLKEAVQLLKKRYKN